MFMGSSANTLQQFKQYGPTLESLGIRKTNDVPEFLPPVTHQTVTIDEDISDSEIDSYILTESEVAIKTDYWMKANGDIMKVIEERKREREENGDVKKKRKTPRQKNVACTSVLNAMEKVIQEKKLSNKVNYEMLKDLETMASGTRTSLSESTPITPVTPRKIIDSEVTSDTLSRSEKQARSKNLIKSGGTSLESLRTAFDLKVIGGKDAPSTNTEKKLTTIKNEDEGTTSTPTEKETVSTLETVKTDKFTVNCAFTDKRCRVRLAQVNIKTVVEEKKDIDNEVSQDRQYQIDACVVRIMKARKELTHVVLMNEVVQQLKFPVKAADIKIRLESLIEREYIARDEEDSAKYKYVA
uniref:Cullin_Nedd8 domain-containing protein n=1 Tax=Caenorhabditis japonica TaxID=281687 RepID=A0A8R1E3D5_CAEJA